MLKCKAIIVTRWFFKTRKNASRNVHEMFIAIFDKHFRAVTVGAILIDQKVGWRHVVMHSKRASHRNVTSSWWQSGRKYVDVFLHGDSQASARRRVSHLLFIRQSGLLRTDAPEKWHAAGLMTQRESRPTTRDGPSQRKGDEMEGWRGRKVKKRDSPFH